MNKTIINYVLLFVIIIGASLAAYTLLFKEDVSSNSARKQESPESFVYETEVDSASDCSSYEKFNAENNTCYYECISEDECKQISSDIDAELASFADEYENNTTKTKENTKADDNTVKAEYVVQKGEQIQFIKGDNAREYNDIWDTIKELSPNALSDTFIEQYQIFDNAQDDTLAFVDDEDGNGKWRIAVNLAGHKSSTVKEQKATIIHELGHIITLNTNQIDASAQTCTTHQIDEGCAKNSSYLYNFVKEFWPSKNQKYTATKFVTEYAATNEVEDLAESFTFFVLDGKKEDQPLKNQKVNSFYNYPDLLQIRSDMRSVLSKEIVRAKRMQK
jgi:hypothetical protein